MRLFLAIVVAGSLVGLVGALFLMTLRFAETARIALISLADGSAFPSWLAALLVCLVAASLAAWLASRFAPDAPQTAEANSDEPPERQTSVPAALSVNFAGTGLAIGSGLALGPERPAIQMGAAIGRAICRLARLKPGDRDIFVAAAGGAGVATMFNAPLGCAAYTVEAVVKRVDFKLSGITLGMGGIAVAVAQWLSGRSTNFDVELLMPGGTGHLVLFFVMGGLIALLARLHVQLIMTFARLADDFLPRPPVRAACVGGVIGLLAWFTPELVGTGETITQSVLDGKFALTALAAIFLIRFLLGPLSLMAGTPGGYFTPVLLLGATVGAVFGSVVVPFFPEDALFFPGEAPLPAAFAVVGMAVALAFVANAPFTGIILVLETTGAFSLALPMTFAILAAMLVARISKTPSLSSGLKAALHTRQSTD